MVFGVVLWSACLSIMSHVYHLRREMIAYQMILTQLPLAMYQFPRLIEDVGCQIIEANDTPNPKHLSFQCQDQLLTLWLDPSYARHYPTQSIYYRFSGKKKVEWLVGIEQLNIKKIHNDYVISWYHCSHWPVSDAACKRLPKPGLCLSQRLCWPYEHRVG